MIGQGAFGALARIGLSEGGKLKPDFPSDPDQRIDGRNSGGPLSVMAVTGCEVTRVPLLRFARSERSHRPSVLVCPILRQTMLVAILILIWSIIVLLFATGLLLPSESPSHK